ncbi:hypothetical protein GCM10029992_14310 [Glycomyces albus]
MIGVVDRVQPLMRLEHYVQAGLSLVEITTGTVEGGEVGVHVRLVGEPAGLDDEFERPLEAVDGRVEIAAVAVSVAEGQQVGDLAVGAAEFQIGAQCRLPWETASSSLPKLKQA